jgi:hypothetical protein
MFVEESAARVKVGNVRKFSLPSDTFPVVKFSQFQFMYSPKAPFI